jgi:hypothetical protein
MQSSKGDLNKLQPTKATTISKGLKVNVDRIYSEGHCNHSETCVAYYANFITVINS